MSFRCRDFAARVGIKTAPEKDEKSFCCVSEGTLLGIRFNTVEWTWTLEQRKAVKISRLLWLVVQGECSGKELESLCGKLAFYMDVFEGQWERGFLLEALRLAKLTSLTEKIGMSAPLVSQARWWIRKIWKAERTPSRIPDFRALQPAAGVYVFPDSAGGLSR